jgi:hypothetical protein
MTKSSKYIKNRVIHIIALFAMVCVVSSCKKEDVKQTNLSKDSFVENQQKTADFVIVTEEEEKEILKQSEPIKEIRMLYHYIRMAVPNFGVYVVFKFDESRENVLYGTVDKSYDSERVCYERLYSYYQEWHKNSNIPTINCTYESKKRKDVVAWAFGEAEGGYKVCIGYDEEKEVWYAISNRKDCD